MGIPLWTREVIETPCTIEIEQTHEYFYAHLQLDGGIEVEPGDTVKVHGDPIRVAFGEKLTQRRHATIVRANMLDRLWTKLSARLEMQELYEVSFTPGRIQ
jgi:hypothetical protein